MKKTLTSAEFQFATPSEICLKCRGNLYTCDTNKRTKTVLEAYKKIPADCIPTSDGRKKDNCPFAE